MKATRLFGQAAALAALATIVLIHSCAGGAGTGVLAGQPRGGSPLVGDKLTGLPAFPVDRAVSVDVQRLKNAADTVSQSAGAITSGTDLKLPGGSGTLQYGVYTWNTGGDPAVRMSWKKATPAGQCYVGIANYTTGRWEISGPFGTVNSSVELNSGDSYVSPGGNATCFIGVFSGTTAQLQTATLTIDSNVPVFAISGTVSEGGGPLAGVNVALGGDASANTTTDAQGAYSFSGLVDGNYTLTPSKASYSFVPASTPVNIAGANVTGQNFAGTPAATTFNVSGTVTEVGGFPGIDGVLLTLTPGGLNANSAAPAGMFTIANVPNGNYTLTPSKTGYTFNPTSLPVTVNNGDVTGLSFEGSQPPAITYETGAGQIKALLGVTTGQGGKCDNCHTSSSDGGVRFNTYASITANSPGFPGQKVYDRILVRVQPGGGMPFGRPQLSAAERQLIADWIAAGAPQ